MAWGNKGCCCGENVIYAPNNFRGIISGVGGRNWSVTQGETGFWKQKKNPSWFCEYVGAWELRVRNASSQNLFVVYVCTYVGTVEIVSRKPEFLLLVCTSAPPRKLRIMQRKDKRISSVKRKTFSEFSQQRKSEDTELRLTHISLLKNSIFCSIVS